MSNPSPICVVKDGSGSYVSTIDGVDVTSGNTITVKLFDTTGVVTWSLTVLGTDELSQTTITSDSNNQNLPQATINVADTSGFNNSGTFFIKEIGATVTYSGKTSTTFTGCSGGTGLLVTGQTVQAVNPIVNNITKTATFTAPQPGSAIILKSVVNGGVDSNGTNQASYTTTLGVYVLATTGYRTGAAGEKLEGSAAFGWITKINPVVRNTAVLGTGNAGAGLVLSGQALNVGQNADNSITVNANDIQLKPAYQTLLDGATNSATGSTLAQRDTNGKITLAETSGGDNRTTYGGNISIYERNSGFSISQTTRTTNNATNDITISTQAPYASATLTNRLPGDFVINIPLAAGALATTNSGNVHFAFDGNPMVSIYQIPSTGNGVIEFPNDGSIQNCLQVQSQSTLGVSSAGALNLEGTPINLTSTGDITAQADNLITFTGDGGITLVASSGTALILQSGGVDRFKADNTGIGFFAATPVTKPTVTGSRGGNAALASVLTALANLGLITNSSS